MKIPAPTCSVMSVIYYWFWSWERTIFCSYPLLFRLYTFLDFHMKLYPKMKHLIEIDVKWWISDDALANLSHNGWKKKEQCLCLSFDAVFIFFDFAQSNNSSLIRRKLFKRLFAFLLLLLWFLFHIGAQCVYILTIAPKVNRVSTSFQTFCSSSNCNTMLNGHIYTSCIDFSRGPSFIFNRCSRKQFCNTINFFFLRISFVVIALLLNLQIH